MNTEYLISYIASCSSIIPVSCVLLRKRELKAQSPAFFIWAGIMLIEVIQSIASPIQPSTPQFVYYYIFFLAECLTIITILKQWELHKGNKRSFFVIRICCIGGWIAIGLLSPTYSTMDNISGIIYPYLLAILCIGMINQIALSNTRNLISNGKFLISCGWLLLYTFQVFYTLIISTVFLNFSGRFQWFTYSIFNTALFISNLIIATGILLIKKDKGVKNKY